MKIRAKFAILRRFLLAALLSATHPVFAMETVSYPVTDPALNAVGRVYFFSLAEPDPILCSGVLVDANVVLTAGHCVRAMEEDASMWAVFVPGVAADRRPPRKFYSVQRVATLMMPRRFPSRAVTGGPLQEDAGLNNDIAALVLSSKVVGIPPMAVADLSMREIRERRLPLSLVGYPYSVESAYAKKGMIPPAISPIQNCHVVNDGPATPPSTISLMNGGKQSFEKEFDQLRTSTPRDFKIVEPAPDASRGVPRIYGLDCDTEPGNSGSPVLTKLNNRWCAIGLVDLGGRKGGGSVFISLRQVGKFWIKSHASSE